MFFEKMFVVFKCSENSVNHKTIFNKMCVSYQWEDLYSRKGGGGVNVPEREVHCSKSARICKAKIILIRQNYFASNINSGSRCTNSDNNAQSL